MNTFLKILLTAIAVLILERIIPGIKVEDFVTAIIVALVISILNIFIRPLIIFFTLPATVVTLGLFLFVINAIIVLLADYLIKGFKVDGFFEAFFFSILLSILRSILLSFVEPKPPKQFRG